ncbi:MAG: carbamoyltransferase HypF [Methanophagales archaeon ANME-1-THS]|nr:MAG: carbamoyltransferase HypF [Methanophagales archaeon ANME-1-THS]
MKIVIKGTVQGVGFRPTVYRVATALGLKGYVLNKGSNVEIGIQEQGKKDEFLNRLMKNLPPLAALNEIEVNDDPVSGYQDFEILMSSEGEKTSVTPVDTAICDACVKEVLDVDNRRYLYPFINCTSCGARFSVILNVPYDRANTSMRDFTMCEHCRAEYKNPQDRRFHAQTISCPQCGPKYTLHGRNGEVLDERNPIEAFAKLVDEGALAIAKGWGGMHLICTFDQASRLRKLYGRPAKPFAVMFRDLNAIENYLEFDAHEENLLTSAHRPIVLLDKRSSPDDLSAIAPGLGTIGAYLPYSGLHYVLFHYLSSEGIIMTSANISGEPMAIRNEDAFRLSADYFLVHNRRIVNRVDDSVIRCYGDKNFFLRRSRGFVPTSFKVRYPQRILSLGAGENVTSSISKGGNLYTSQYIGNTYHYPTVEYLASGTEQLLRLLGLSMADFDAIGVDLHPRYPTRRYGKQLSEEWSIELVEVQHHWAHAASLLLDRAVDEIVALTLDGTGYGVDGTAWGGEILHANYKAFDRVGSLEEIPLVGGEMAIKDPRRLLFAIFSRLGRDTHTAQFVDEQEARVLEKLVKKAPRTSSFGRVLDALSCYLGVAQRMTYDGEPAMKLERYLAKGERTYEFETTVKRADREIVLTLPLFDQLAEYQLHTEKERADIAYSFVYALVKEMVEIAADACSATGITAIGITGGVSYDVPIVRLAEAMVKEKGLRFLTHDKIPNGDGGISLGQNAIVGHLKERV